MNKKNLLMILVLLVLTSSFGFSEIDSYLLEANDGEVYKYDFEKLKSSYQSYVFGGTAIFYEHFKSILENGGDYKAIYDSSDRYVDYSDVKQAYANAVLTGDSNFNLNQYIEIQAKEADIPNVLKSVDLNEAGDVDVEDENISKIPTFVFTDVAGGMGIGTRLVKVELDTETPENYVVTVGETELEFNSSANAFTGEVASENANESAVEVLEVESVNPEALEVISIN